MDRSFSPTVITRREMASHIVMISDLASMYLAVSWHFNRYGNKNLIGLGVFDWLNLPFSIRATADLLSENKVTLLPWISFWRIFMVFRSPNASCNLEEEFNRLLCIGKEPTKHTVYRVCSSCLMIFPAM